jgi:hypothetical protein
MAIKGGALAAAREVLALQQARRAQDDAYSAAPRPAEPPLEPGAPANRVIEAWKRHRGPDAPT